MKMDTPQQFSSTTVALHWLVAIAVIGMLAIGIYMTETETFGLYPWHKSFGVLVFFLVSARIIWRIRNGWPVPVAQVPQMEQRLARTVHYVLIISTLLMPVSGFLMSSLGGTGVALFGLEIVARNPDPENPARVIAHNEVLASFFRSIHGWVAWLLVISILLHVTGALKQHFVNRNATLKRMLGGRAD